MDGAYFRTDFIDIFVGLHPEAIYTEALTKFVPRTYAFRIWPSAQAVELGAPPPE
jgi:hypothetical protein